MIPTLPAEATIGLASAAISSEMASGKKITENLPTRKITAYPAAAMTSRRHDQAAARSIAHGTWARLKLLGPASITGGTTTC